MLAACARHALSHFLPVDFEEEVEVEVEVEFFFSFFFRLFGGNKRTPRVVHTRVLRFVCLPSVASTIDRLLLVLMMCCHEFHGLGYRGGEGIVSIGAFPA